MAWRDLALAGATAAEDRFDALKRHLASRVGTPDPVQVLPYRDFGTAGRLELCGRVLEDEGGPTQGRDDSLWFNVLATWRRLESDEVPGARVVARLGGRSWEAVSDREGYVRWTIEPPPEVAAAVAGGGWVDVEVEIAELPGDMLRRHGLAHGGRAVGEVLVPSPAARFAVVSDLDDTIVETGATKKLVMARNTFLRNAHTRLPFEGVGAFYRALARGGGAGGPNPVFYVSSSPWNLYDLLRDFLSLHGLPDGPLLLRDLGLDRTRLLAGSHDDHKLAQIRRVLETYPHLPLILLGDSGQRDPEIYRRVVEEHPGRVLAVYLRDVTRTKGRSAEIADLWREAVEGGVEMVLAEDTVAAAESAAARGWIAAEEVDRVREDRARDHAAPEPEKAAVEAGVSGEGAGQAGR